MKAAISYT